MWSNHLGEWSVFFPWHTTIPLLNSYVCESDQIMADGVACTIITVKVLY
ncbi:MAG: hypothetical protein ACLQGU_10470 [bacterium]